MDGSSKFIMLISVIVPIFNTGQYLYDCLNSILRQTYKNIEIILVDDGSTDASYQICIEYAKRDSRIVTIRSEHQGLISARKLGLEKSKGEYCLFVDSDDWIAEDLLSSIVPLTDNGAVDIVNYNIKSVKNTIITEWKYTIPDGVYKYQQLENIYRKMMFDFDSGCPGIIQSLCSKLIKKDILLKSMEFIDTRITMGEDAAVTYNAMLLAKKVAIVGGSYFYFYRVRQNSICSSKDSNIFLKICYFQKYMQNIFEKYDEKYDLYKQLQAYLIAFIQKGMSDVFSIKMQSIYHLPFSWTVMGQKIILYGAGTVGRSYYKQLKQISGIDIIAWVDSELVEHQIYDYRIDSPKVIVHSNFDKIVIAIKNRSIAEKIKNDLCQYISKEKILWEEPRINWWEKEIDV